MSKIYDITIVGAGPAGLYAAYLLQKKGWKVLVLEANPDIQRKICGEYLCPNGVSLLKEQGDGDLIEFAERLDGMKLVSTEGRIIKSYFPDTNQKNYGVSVNRKRLEENLLKKYQSVGGEILFSTPVTQIELNGDLVQVASNDKKFVSRFIIGADGRKSRVSKFFHVDVVSKQKRIAIHCYYKPLKKLERLGQMHILKGGAYVGIDPINDNEVNFSIVCDAETIKSKTKAEVRKYLNDIILNSKILSGELGPIPDDAVVSTVFPIQHKVSDVSGKYFALIGDAAGFIDPLTGEGMYNGFLTAKLLTDNINKSATLFDFSKATSDYSESKKKIMNEKIRLNFFFQWLIHKPILVECVAYLLSLRPKFANVFIGIIGNVYSPLQGLKKFII